MGPRAVAPREPGSDSFPGPVRAGKKAASQHMGMGEKIQPTKSREQRSRGTAAHPASLGKPWTTLGAEGCGTSIRGHRLHLHGSFWMHPHTPPAPAHPTCMNKRAQLLSGTQLPLLSSPSQMFPSLDLSIPKATFWSLSGRHSLEPVATCSTSHPPIWFHCIPLRRNVPVLFPRRLPGKDSRDCPHQGRLSQQPQPWCHASHGHDPPSPSPPWARRVPRGPRGDVAPTSDSW